MPSHLSYSQARAQLSQILNDVIDHREPVIIRRRGKEDVALIAASELAGLLETAHLLRSPKNAERLISALNRARNRSMEPEPLENLRREIKIRDKTN